MWSFARQDLRLTDRQFYALTPRQFHELAERYRQAREHEELMFGQLTAWVVNTGYRSTRKPVEPKDFMPSQWGRRTTKRVRGRRQSTIDAEIRATMAHFMGSNAPKPSGGNEPKLP